VDFSTMRFSRILYSITTKTLNPAQIAYISLILTLHSLLDELRLREAASLECSGAPSNIFASTKSFWVPLTGTFKAFKNVGVSHSWWKVLHFGVINIGGAQQLSGRGKGGRGKGGRDAEMWVLIGVELRRRGAGLVKFKSPRRMFGATAAVA
jgi:hypothetical protein